MSDYNKAGPQFTIEFQHQFINLCCGVLIEIASWLIGQHTLWFGHKGAGDCGALAFTAG